MNAVGVDVSAKEIIAEIERGERIETAKFSNTAAGHRQLIRWSNRGKQSARVCLESTGAYSLGLALALHRAEGIEVMVANPKAVRHFAEAQMVRAKTDGVDAGVNRAYLVAMPFKPWQPPQEQAMELQALSRRIQQLKKELAREKSRLHAASQEGMPNKLVVRDLRVHVRFLERRIAVLGRQAQRLVQASSALKVMYRLIDSAPGFAETTSVQLLGELATLEPDMSAAQWVAYSGLDPRPVQSGTSINRPRRISRRGNARLRAALYMPALVAIQHDRHVKAFYDQLIDQGKRPMQAITAVMRKMLHALWGMLQHNQPWDGSKFYSTPTEA